MKQGPGGRGKIAGDSLHMIFAHLFTGTEFIQCSASVGPHGKVDAMKKQLPESL